MKAMLLAFLVTAILAVIADYTLGVSGWSAAERNTGAAVRLE